MAESQHFLGDAKGIPLGTEWQRVLKGEFHAPYMTDLQTFLQTQKHQGKTIYPPNPDIFAAFNLTPFSQVKVVILGQDPYHGQGQAHGLCFSVRPGIAIPPSLVNIYKELQNDLGITQPRHGNLEHWSRQGVLLLNAVLTVEQSKAASHRGRGWEKFTDQAIAALNAQREHLVFLLWGSYAQKKGQHIDRERHLVLESVHPSPLSAHRGFFGTHQFSRTNAYLQEHGLPPIDWQLPSLP